MKIRLAFAVGMIVLVAGVILALYYKANAPLLTIPLASATRSMEFSPDGKTLSMCTNTGVVLYDTTKWKPGLLLRGHTDFSYWMPDKKLLTFGYFSVDLGIPTHHSVTEMTLWDIKTGSVIHRTAYSAYEVVALSSDRTMAALWCKQGVKIISTATGRSLHEFPPSAFFEPQFSPDGRYYAYVARAKSPDEMSPVHVWDTRNWREVLGPAAQKIRGCCLCFSPDGRTLATGTPSAVALWDTKTWRAVRTMPARFKYLFRLRFSSDGTRLAGGGRFQGEAADPDFFWTLWNPGNGERIAEIHNAYFWNFLPNSEVALTEDRVETRLWDGASGKLLWSSAGRIPDVDKWTEQTSLALSPDHNTLTTATNYYIGGGPLPAEIGHPPTILQIWNMPQR